MEQNIIQSEKLISVKRSFCKMSFGKLDSEKLNLVKRSFGKMSGYPPFLLPCVKVIGSGCCFDGLDVASWIRSGHIEQRG